MERKNISRWCCVQCHANLPCSIFDSTSSLTPDNEVLVLKAATSGEPFWWHMEKNINKSKTQTSESEIKDDSDNALNIQIMANKSQQRSKKRTIESNEENQWIRLLCSIDRMTLPKARAIQSAFPHLTQIVDSAKTDTAKTLRTIADLTIETNVAPDGKATSSSSRRIGPALAKHVLESLDL